MTDLVWHKSSFSGGGGQGGGNCVEAAVLSADRYALRDSKNPDAPVMEIPRAGFAALLRAAR
jgi:hypothetical protein